jgi:hypothetical protein
MHANIEFDPLLFFYAFDCVRIDVAGIQVPGFGFSNFLGDAFDSVL